jgi:dienelactone hydrolase
MWAMAGLVMLVAVFLGSALRVGIHPVVDFMLGTLAILALAALCSAGTAVAIALGRPLAGLFSRRAVLLIAGAAGAMMIIAAMMLPLIVPFFLLLLAGGGVAGAASGGGFGSASMPKKAVMVVAGAGVCVAAVVFVYGMLSRGTDDHLIEFIADPVQVDRIGADDPSQPGPFTVSTLTYGSGTDKRRSEFGENADLTTEPVDATKLVKGSEGWRMKLRHRFWGFDFSSFPVNGRVWYPEGDGPFPLVLCVHGNHGMEEYSDPGYAYLGELLASRGFIFVSVDENFFNGSWRGGLTTENDGRGWMMLQHLRVWRKWNQTAGHTFESRVAMDRIALIGHSRGGEAAAIAGAFNRLSHYPDDATLAFDFGFGIRSIVAIAPSDGQYEPADRPTPLSDVSYLVIQGAHDQDVMTFMGARQYRRVNLGDDGYHFKASVYSYRSNHGQFNTVWGDTDYPFPASLVLNRKPLLTGDQQRRVGSLYIAAFLEATLNDRQEYVRVFRDHRCVAHALPDDFFITRFQDTTFRRLADFEDDVDVTTGSIDGVRIEGSELAVWREEHQSFRKFGSKKNGIAVVGWRAPDHEHSPDDIRPARYALHLTPDTAAELRITAESSLVFALADIGKTPPDPDEDEKGEVDDRSGGDASGKDKAEDDGETEDDDAPKQPLDLTLELTTADGIRSSLVLGEVRRVQVPLDSQLTKLPFEDKIFGPAWEPTLQTFEVPMSAFVEAVPDFDPTVLTSISFVFDQSPEGVIFLDDIGFAEPFTR